jgi:hypothetical protein
MRVVRALAGLTGLALVGLGAPDDASAQGRGRGNAGGGRGGGGADQPAAPAVTVAVNVALGASDKERILAFYRESPPPGLESLPPGIRRNLERGKPLPPGIARRGVPAGLRAQLSAREGFELVEVGLDVFLVEVPTGVIHDVLMDIVR